MTSSSAKRSMKSAWGWVASTSSKRCGCDWSGVFVVEDAHGPYRHGGAVEGIVGAESLRAAGAGEHALGVEGVDAGFVDPAGHRLTGST